MRAYNNYLDNQDVPTVTATATSLSSSAERRKVLRLKRVVVSEHNYLALKRLGQAGDSFNDVISKLLRIEMSYHEMKKRQQRPQENRNNNDGLSFLGNPSGLFDEYDK